MYQGQQGDVDQSVCENYETHMYMTIMKSTKKEDDGWLLYYYERYRVCVFHHAKNRDPFLSRWLKPFRAWLPCGVWTDDLIKISQLSTNALKLTRVTLSYNSYSVFFFVLAHPLYLVLYLHFSFSFSLPRRDTDLRPLRRLFSPVPTTAHAFVFVGRRLELLVPSLTRIELNLPTLVSYALSALDSFFSFCKWTQKSNPCGIRTAEPTLV